MKLDFEDKLLMAGCGCVVAGVALIYIPAGVITLGVALISLGVLIGKKKADDGIAE